MGSLGGSDGTWADKTWSDGTWADGTLATKTPTLSPIYLRILGSGVQNSLNLLRKEREDGGIWGTIRGGMLYHPTFKG